VELLRLGMLLFLLPPPLASLLLLLLFLLLLSLPWCMQTRWRGCRAAGKRGGEEREPCSC